MLAMPQAVAPPQQPYVQSPKGNPDFVPVVQKAANQFPPLKNWNVVVLTEPQWNEMYKQIGTDKMGHPTDSAFSMMDLNRTYLRQSWLQGKTPEQVEAKLAHEYGHLTLHSHKEDDANRWAEQWAQRNK
jgi:hypothetical protein